MLFLELSMFTHRSRLFYFTILSALLHHLGLSSGLGGISYRLEDL